MSFAESDLEILDVRSRFYMGDYEGARKEAAQLSISGAIGQERDDFVLRCFLAEENYEEVLQAVDNDSPISSQLIKLHAALKVRGPKGISSKVEDLCSAGISTESTAVIACALYIALNDLRNAYKTLASIKGLNLEASLSKVQILLTLNRYELARQELKKMQQEDEDHPLSILASIWCTLRNGKEGEEAYTFCGDLSAKYTNTPLLLNLKTVAQMQQGSYVEALEEITECHQMTSSGEQYRISLTNQISCLLHLGKLVDSQEVFNRLQKQFPDCEYLKTHADLSKKFDKFCANYKSK